ncbi:MAG: hypothetical protein H6Q13_2800 [Bacteroidetes bacterium]|nr:hypothetical protein [Bacteroidota bacterium]
MKNLLLLILCLFAVASCSDKSMSQQDDDTTPEDSTVGEVIASNRAMWVSYDANPNKTKGHTSGYSHALVSWRLLGTDPSDVAFDIYKSENGESEKKLSVDPIKNTTCWADTNINAAVDNVYRVTLTGSSETLCEYRFTAEMAKTFFRKITLNLGVPNAALTYEANDAQVGDLDGDGEMEIVLKRQPYDGANQGGWHDGTTLLEAYKIDGTFLWQIDMGINIRSGSHYTSFIVYDFDGDGKCEIAFRSSEGTQFGNGTQITDSNGKVNDYRQTDVDGKGWYSGKSLYSTAGLILDGPEYISICNGSSGAEIARTNNISRGGEGTNYERAKYWFQYWGDDYGNRMDRFFIGVAYLDGIPKNGVRISNPSLIISRGIYKNWQVWALDLKGNELKNRWKFDTSNEGYASYAGMGSHSFRIADLNGDGYDEILYGAVAISHTGTGLYCTGNGHGDALHVGKFDPTRSGLQIVACYEEESVYTTSGYNYGCAMMDAATGTLLFGHGAGKNGDVGRCLVADVCSTSPGCEYWSSLGTGIYSCETGQLVNTVLPTYKGGGNSYNNAIFWTGSLTRQMLDDVMIQSYEPSAPWAPDFNENWTRVITFSYYGDGVKSNNSTKANPCFYGDFLGDYREEVIYRSSDNTAIYIMSTNHPTEHRFVHLMEDHTYDMGQAMQNMGYNQPTHLGYYIGADLEEESE